MKDNCKYDVIAVGEVLIDFSTVGTTDENYPVMAANAGGAPANFLSTLAKFGKKTAFVGKVGDDAFGYMLADTLADAGIDVSHIIFDRAHFTTLAFVTLDENGDREISFARKPGADTQLTEREVPTDMIEDANIIHFGTLSLTDEPSRTALKTAVLHAKNEGGLITFDPNLRRPLWSREQDALAAIEWGLRQADVVKLSEEEAEFILGDCPYGAAAFKLKREYGLSLVMITLGKDGAYLENGKGGVLIENPSANTVDTTGAGDIFGGAAVSKLLSLGKHPSELSTDELYEIGEFACAAASLSTEKRGGIPSIPEISAVEAFIKSN